MQGGILLPHKLKTPVPVVVSRQGGLHESQMAQCTRPHTLQILRIQARQQVSVSSNPIRFLFAIPARN